MIASGVAQNNMAYFNEKTGHIELTREDKQALNNHETPEFITNFWQWISKGKVTSEEELPKPPKVDITK